MKIIYRSFRFFWILIFYMEHFCFVTNLYCIVSPSKGFQSVDMIRFGKTKSKQATPVQIIGST